MLSYRHGFHAGNFADVLKHTTLAAVANYFRAKAKPLLYLDTHAGAGDYRLDDADATRLAEFERGIARLWGTADAPAACQPYLNAVGAMNADGRLRRYPGSGTLARALLGPIGRYVLCELHPRDFAALERRFAGDRRVQVQRTDGWTALDAYLPPVERRGIVLIDPSYELDRDYRQAPRALASALRRFATGVYLLWYPIVRGHTPRRFLAGVAAAINRPLLHVELHVGSAAQPGLSGCGMVVVNPVWGLDQALAAALPWLCDRLAPQPAHYHLARAL